MSLCLHFVQVYEKGPELGPDLNFYDMMPVKGGFL